MQSSATWSMYERGNIDSLSVWHALRLVLMCNITPNDFVEFIRIILITPGQSLYIKYHMCSTSIRQWIHYHNNKLRRIFQSQIIFIVFETCNEVEKVFSPEHIITTELQQCVNWQNIQVLLKGDISNPDLWPFMYIVFQPASLITERSVCARRKKNIVVSPSPT